ncbi:MFS transporter [Conyzicola nivalis]|uniref:MFS transporter n=1 Tax=Conyzicola nivalis TaxID=1477021 RepID=A0A916SQK5_9MICO|nr:MFS transporter [Conyzicola nivalis]GGB08474.1 MFS transporter [Conyzicola nivalis]
MRTLSRRASFLVAAAIAAIALWTSAAPTVTYPVYAAEWQLPTSATTAIFAVYPIVLVLALAVFGNLSDYIGRRASILIGLLGSFVGVVLFAVAPSVEWLFVGRAFMGLGVAFSLSPATAAIVEFSKPGQGKRAGAITTASTAIGIVLAMLVGGALIEYAPLPTHLNFVVLAAVVAVVAGFAWFLPRHTAAEAQGRWRPRGITVPHGIRRFFLIGAVSVTAAFAVGVIVLSLGADIAQELIQSDNALVNGAVLALNAAAIAVAAIVLRNVRAVNLIMIGAGATVVGLAVMLASSMQHSLALFLVAAVITGVGYSLLFGGGLGIVSTTAPAHHRAGTLSAVYLIAYFFQGATALFLGALATGYDLQLALEIGAGIVTVFSLTALTLAFTLGRGPQPDLTPATA